MLMWNVAWHFNIAYIAKSGRIASYGCSIGYSIDGDMLVHTGVFEQNKRMAKARMNGKMNEITQADS